LQLKSIFFLVLFSGFLLLPAVMVLSNLEVNITSYFSMTEEENTDTFKVEPSDRTPCVRNLLPETHLETALRNRVESRHLFNWKAIYFDTLSPPPEGLFA
jgi:hypothetical protein